MDRHERRTQDLTLTPEVARVLGALRTQAGQDLGVSLDVDRVRDVEGSIGSILPDAVLAVVAADVPGLRDDLRLQLSEMTAHGKAARAAKVRGDFVAVAAESDGQVFHGFLKHTAETHMATFQVKGRDVSSQEIARWLEEHAGMKAPDAGPLLAARLELRLTPEGEGARVRHKTFGLGRVIVEEGEGPTRKLKVDFPAHGLKVIQARFVTYETPEG